MGICEKPLAQNGFLLFPVLALVHDERQCSDLCFQQTPKASYDKKKVTTDLDPQSIYKSALNTTKLVEPVTRE